MRNLVAFYSTREQATAARDELIAAGYDNSDVKFHDYSGRSSDEKGLWQSIKEAFGFADEEDHRLYTEAVRRGAYAISLDVEDIDDQASSDRAIAIMRRHNPIDLDQQATQWRSQGWTGYTDTSAQRAGANLSQQTTQRKTERSQQAGGQEVIPVVQEELRVGKRAVQQGGIRVYTRVTERPVEEQVNLRSEKVTVERRPTDRPVTNADAAFRERTIDASETREEAVVNKQARVVEEVALNKQVDQRTETIRDTVRRTDVDVQQLPGQGRSDTEWTEEFVSTLGSDQRYRGRDWDAIETDARSSFEKRYPGRKWDQFKDQIRRSYDKIRSKV